MKVDKLFNSAQYSKEQGLDKYQTHAAKPNWSTREAGEIVKGNTVNNDPSYSEPKTDKVSAIKYYGYHNIVNMGSKNIREEMKEERGKN